MKFRNLLSILSLSLVTSIGAFYGLTKNNEVKPVKAEEVAKFCIFEGDEYEMNYNSETFEYFIENVPLSLGQAVYIKYNDTIYDFDYLDDDSYQLFFTADDNYIGISEDSTYCFYFIFDVDNTYIRATVDATSEANDWALQFLEGLDCSQQNETGPVNWGEWTSSFQNLTNEAKDLFIEANASIEAYATAVEQAAYLHDFCVTKYGDKGLAVFMCRDDGGSRGYLIARSNSNNVEFNSVALIITVASVTSITLLLTLLVVKKHKK